MKKLAIVLALATPAAAHAETYVRAGLGYERSSEAGFRDVDCTQTAPPALFGCAAAADGTPLTARGDFGSAVAGELGLGWRATRHLRLEVIGTWRPDLDFRGNANFLRTPGEQRVDANLDSMSLMGAAFADLGVYGRARPFVGAGLGAYRNRMGEVRYTFPGLAANASTVVPSGTHSGTAWMATVGFGWTLSNRMTLDVAYRYTDLGEVRSDAGPAVITRTSGVRSIDIAPTHAELVTQGVNASIRLAF